MAGGWESGKCKHFPSTGKYRLKRFAEGIVWHDEKDDVRYKAMSRTIILYNSTSLPTQWVVSYSHNTILIQSLISPLITLPTKVSCHSFHLAPIHPLSTNFGLVLSVISCRINDGQIGK